MFEMWVVESISSIPRSTTPGPRPAQGFPCVIASEITVPHQGRQSGRSPTGPVGCGPTSPDRLPCHHHLVAWPRRSCLIQGQVASRPPVAILRPAREGRDRPCHGRQDHRLRLRSHPFGHQTRQHARLRQQPDSAAVSASGRRSASSTALAWLACMASSRALGSSWT